MIHDFTKESLDILWGVFKYIEQALLDLGWEISEVEDKNRDFSKQVLERVYSNLNSAHSECIKMKDYLSENIEEEE